MEDDYLPNARHVIVVAGLTNWPSELEDGAMGVQKAAIALVTALDEGDAEAAKQPATDLHDAWHDFEHEALAHAAEDAELPPEAGIEGDDHGASAGDETPTAEETAVTDRTPGTDETPSAEGTAEEGDDHSG